MKKRSSWLWYLASLASSGVAFFVWLYLIMRDVNYAEGRSIFSAKQYKATISIGGALLVLLLTSVFYTSGNTSGARQIFIVATFFVGLSLNLYLFVMIARVSAYVSRSLGYVAPAAQALLIVLLMFCGGVSLIVLQARTNTLIDSRARTKS
jgi:hypothetical protein